MIEGGEECTREKRMACEEGEESKEREKDKEGRAKKESTAKKYKWLDYTMFICSIPYLSQ